MFISELPFSRREKEAKPMEGDFDGGVREPLLGGRVIENSSLLTSSPLRLRGDFVSRLPEKVRHGVDPENPCQIDVSRINGLLKGTIFILVIKLD